MIDWLTCRIPVTLPQPINGGHTAILDRAGVVLKTIPHRLSVQGSFESSLAVRAPSTSELEISGNLVKWLQGHNLYGISDPLALLWAVLQRLEGHPDVFPCTLAEAGIFGPESLLDTILTRVDCTAMLLLPTPGDVLAFIRAAHATGTLAHRGRGIMREGTLVYGDAAGKSFARWQIVLYSKGQEIGAHRLPDFMMVDGEVLEWTNRCLRTEVRLGRLELEKQGLRRLGNWDDAKASMMWSAKMAQIDFNEGDGSSAVLENLPRNLRATYAAWTTGEDIRTMLSRRTFFRYRRQLQELAGVDIAIPPPKVPTGQVVPFKRVLEAVPAGRPAWADRVDRQLREAGALVLTAAA
jgi:II/X family phage/plasmid replication protein